MYIKILYDVHYNLKRPGSFTKNTLTISKNDFDFLLPGAMV